jgi:lipid-A-disaccharide synthase-like uncharacterized protein
MPELVSKMVAQCKEPVEILGFAAQFVFFMRFFVQWLVSEKKKEVTIPVGFWWLSIAGGAMQAWYGVWKGAPNLFLAQAVAVFLYSRNLALHYRKERALKAADGGGTPV